MTKEELIKESYLEYWEQLEPAVQKRALSSNGWLHWDDIVNDNGALTDCIDMDRDIDYYRPKSLRGIEHNNGWIKINDKSDLPKEYKSYWCLTYNGDVKILRFDPEFKEWFYECNRGLMFTVTHYQPIIKPKPPIY